MLIFTFHVSESNEPAAPASVTRVQANSGTPAALSSPAIVVMTAFTKSSSGRSFFDR
ncbi:hypothetical protein ACFO3K_07685 [Cellulomonas algicola]|uniref:hypothetical protein n=1 Tax=Cellulomonas algicola TaxID=2071633 RepID=UPI001C3F6A33|nr:hypothetical protein [Cellulomonas algicola]